jgi:hypothetical protein
MRSIHTLGKRQTVILIAIGVLAVACATTIFSYAVSHNFSTVENQVSLATSGVTIVQDSEAGFGRHRVSFKNGYDDGYSKVLLRIAYSETWTKADGTVISNIASNNNVVAKNWTTDFVSDFVDGHDGWYYYTKVLNPTESVQVLESISLSDQSYSVYNYDLAFRFESVQADATAANTLWGKTVTVGNDGTATWAF